MSVFDFRSRRRRTIEAKQQAEAQDDGPKYAEVFDGLYAPLDKAQTILDKWNDPDVQLLVNMIGRSAERRSIGLVRGMGGATTDRMAAIERTAGYLELADQIAAVSAMLRESIASPISEATLRQDGHALA